MPLRDLQNPTYTSNVDNARRVAFEISTALVEQTEKRCCHVVDGESIDLVERSPCVRAIVIKECISEGLSVGIFRRLRIVEEFRNRSTDSCTVDVCELIVSNELCQQSVLVYKDVQFPLLFFDKIFGLDNAIPT